MHPKRKQGKILMSLNVTELSSNKEGKKKENSAMKYVPAQKHKHDTDSSLKNCQKDLKSIEESIKQFHSDIPIGPLYVCSCCHQTWLRKSVSMLKNTHIPVFLC